MLVSDKKFVNYILQCFRFCTPWYQDKLFSDKIKSTHLNIVKSNLYCKGLPMELVAHFLVSSHIFYFLHLCFRNDSLRIPQITCCSTDLFLLLLPYEHTNKIILSSFSGSIYIYIFISNFLLLTLSSSLCVEWVYFILSFCAIFDITSLNW